MNREQLAWAAGIVDGEGNIRNYKNKKTLKNGKTAVYRSPTIHVAQTAKYGGVPDMLTRLQKIFPGSRIGGPYRIKNRPKSNLDIYDWTLHSFEKVQSAISMMWPWLGKQKRTDASRTMREYVIDRSTNKRSKRLASLVRKRERGKFS